MTWNHLATAVASLFSFRGDLGRRGYAVRSIAAFLTQHLVALVIVMTWGHDAPADWSFGSGVLAVVTPLRLTALSGAPAPVAIAALAYLMMVAWALASLSVRRAADAGISEWIAAAAIAPVVQIPTILILCLAPSRPRRRVPGAGDHPAASSRDWGAAVQGLIAGMALTVICVAAGALVFGSYGFAMFMLSPLMIGAVTGYLGNRRADIGPAETRALVAAATACGGLALVAAALEGIVCLLLAMPPGLAMAVLGGAMGRAIAVQARRPPRHTLSGLAVLPLVFAVETVTTAATHFETAETIVVDAPPALVWQAIVHMDTIEEPPGLPFRLGIAYPLRGDVEGEGVGALRRGEFSTGTAIERVTEWVPERRLAFVVVSDVPEMREISPYAHVHAPHVSGYFRTEESRFELLPTAGGGTEIIEHSAHSLRLEPAFYWLPLVRLVVHLNNARVLAHIKSRSEQTLATGPARRASATPDR